MSRIRMGLCQAAVVVLLLASHLALAEDPPSPLATETLSPATAGTVLGRRVTNNGGEDLGMLVDVLVDRLGNPRAAVIDFGGFMGVGTRRIAISWQLLHFSPENGETRIVEDLSADDAATAPEMRGADGAIVVMGLFPPFP